MSYYSENRETIIVKNSLKHQQRKKEDISYRIYYYVRNRIYNVLKKKNIRLPYNPIILLGCTTEELKKHLEPMFSDGMNWGNYGEWHIDHIKPCASFDLTIDSERLKCFNYKNLQPLWAKDNQIKNAKYSLGEENEV